MCCVSAWYSSWNGTCNFLAVEAERVMLQLPGHCWQVYLSNGSDATFFKFWALSTYFISRRVCFWGKWHCDVPSSMRLQIDLSNIVFVRVILLTYIMISLSLISVFSFSLQDGNARFSHGYWSIWTIKCFFPSLHVPDYVSLFSWIWCGRCTCISSMVPGVHFDF